jgi:hypothetical protein
MKKSFMFMFSMCIGLIAQAYEIHCPLPNTLDEHRVPNGYSYVGYTTPREIEVHSLEVKGKIGAFLNMIIGKEQFICTYFSDNGAINLIGHLPATNCTLKRPESINAVLTVGNMYIECR